jgi:hypothetical protein
MGHRQSRRRSFSRIKHDRQTRHELFESGPVMMSVHFEGEPTPETRAVFQEIVDKIASGEIEAPAYTARPEGRILDVRRE